MNRCSLIVALILAKEMRLNRVVVAQFIKLIWPWDICENVPWNVSRTAGWRSGIALGS